MSQLRISTTYAGSFLLNATHFSSPIYSTMMSAQTKKIAVHFPIKTQQSAVEFDIQFASVTDYQNFQAFVRTTQQNALINDTEPGVTLYWPARGILNWTGTINHFVGGGERFVTAPKAKLAVNLVDSLTSRRTLVSSVSPLFETVYGAGSPEGLLRVPSTTSGAGGSPFAGQTGTG